MAEAHEQPQGPRPPQPDPALATVVQEAAHAPLPNHVRHGLSLAPVVTGRSSGGGLDLDRDILPRESPSQSQATVSVPTATLATPATTTTTTTGIAAAAATAAAAAATISQLPPLPPPLPPPPPPPSQQRQPRANDDVEKAAVARLFDDPPHQQQQRQKPSAGVPAQASQAQAHYRRPPQGVPATHAQSSEGTTSTDGFPRNRSPARALPTSLPVARPATSTLGAATAIAVATELPPTSAPTISVLKNGTSADHARQSGFGAHSPTPKAMSNPHHHQPGPPRQPIPYPSPTYAAPTLSAHYGWAQGGQAAEAYRTSPPTGAPSMSLPSMRTFDAMQQQQQPHPHQPAQHAHAAQHQHQHMSLASPVTQMPAAMPYYPAPAMPLPGNYAAFPADTMPRYALPPGDPRAMMASGRHKKEIKRRTKTGCLTCRKRRIKCDEQHPVCKNCQKSRRECMGYDPIFKQQQQHPTNIQPAPNHPAPPASVPSNGPPPPASTPLSGSSASTYTPLPSVHSGAYMPAPVPQDPLMSSHLAALEANALGSVKTESVAESASAVDPSLDSAIQTPRTSTSHSPGSHSLAPTGYDQREADVPHLRGGGADVVAYSPSPELARTPSYRPRTPADARPSPVPTLGPIPATTGPVPRKMRVPELIGAMFSAVPPKPNMPPSEDQLAGVRDMYTEVYAPGLEKLFETNWFSIQLARLLGNEDVTALLVAFLGVVERDDPSLTKYAVGVEFSVVWSLACLGFSPEQVINKGLVMPESDNEVEVRNRVAVVDALLAGDVLPQNPLFHCWTHASPRFREMEFWWHLGEFLCIKDKPQQFSTPQREETLHKLRQFLDGRENRDLLYSIAMTRTFGPHWPPESDNTLPPHLDELDPRCKLAVARKHITAAREDDGTMSGTTNVIRRIAELAYLAFIQPGMNIARLPAP